MVNKVSSSTVYQRIKNSSKSTKKIIFFGSLIGFALIVVILSISFLTRGSDDSDNVPSASSSVPSEEPVSDESTPTPTNNSSSIENPFKGVSLENKRDSPSTSSVKDNVVRQTEGQSLAIDAESYPIIESSDPCMVSKEQDFCLSATSKVGTLSYDVFSFYNISRTSVFGDAKNVEKVDVKGAKSAFTASMNIDKDSPREVLAVVTKDGLGYLVVSPPGASRGDINGLASHVEVR